MSINPEPTLRGSSLNWLKSCYLGDGDFVFCPDIPAAPVLYNTCYAVLSLGLIGAVDILGSFEKKALSRRILSCQNEHGFFRDASIEFASSSHDRDYILFHLTCCALQALDYLGEKPRPLVFLENYQRPVQIESWLGSMNMKNAWRESNRIMSLLAAMSHSGALETASALNESYHFILDWLEKKQDPITGFWGPDNGSGIMNGMAATYHYLMFFHAAGRNVPRAENIIDSTLSLWLPEGHFSPLGGHSCVDMDAIDILVNLSRFTDHRLSDIKNVSGKLHAAVVALRNPDGGFPEHSKKQHLASALAGAAYSFLKHRCLKTSMFHAKKIAKISLLSKRAVYCGSVRQCASTAFASDLWATFARLMTLAIIESRFPDVVSPTNAIQPELAKMPGLAYGVSETRGEIL